VRAIQSPNNESKEEHVRRIGRSWKGQGRCVGQLGHAEIKQKIHCVEDIELDVIFPAKEVACIFYHNDKT